MARALLQGGVRVREVTLRTAAALKAISRIAKDVPEAMIGAGTVTNIQQSNEAEANGGTQALKALASPFSSVRFCPTGGITPQNARHYLALPNGVCVGGRGW